MNKNRLEAFSDGVLAIIITIMVLEIHVPHEVTWQALFHLAPTLGSYLLSFAFIGIYWNNHHHLLHTVRRINARIMWSNLNLLFWLSLVPFGTAWMGENNFPSVPVIFYAVILLACGYSFDVLRKAIIKTYTVEDGVTHALHKLDQKSMFSIIAYSLAIPLAFVHTAISLALYVSVAVMWFIPSKAIEESLKD